MNEFRRKLLKIDKPKKHKIKSSVGARHIYKMLRSEGEIDKSVKYDLFNSVVQLCNKALAEELISGKAITFPHSMGGAELRFITTKVQFKEGKVVTSRPVDWGATLSLWEEDKEARAQKVLIRRKDKELYFFGYIKSRARFVNKKYFKLQIARRLKAEVAALRKEGKAIAVTYE